MPRSVLSIFLFSIVLLALTILACNAIFAGNYSEEEKWTWAGIYDKIKKSEEIKDSSIELFFAYNRKAYDKARVIGYAKGEADALLNLGIYQLFLKQYLKSLEDCFGSLKIYETIRSDSGIVAVQSVIAQAYTRVKRYDRAIIYFQKALDLALPRNDTLSIILLYGNMGEVYTNLGDYKKAYRCQTEALLYGATCKNDYVNSQVFRSVGTFYLQNNDPKKARQYYQEALVGIERQKKPAHIGTLYTLIAHTYEKENNYPDALKYNLLAVYLRKKYNRENLYASSLLNVGHAYLLISKYDSCYKYLGEGLAVAKKLNEKINCTKMHRTVLLQNRTKKWLFFLK
jgi:tetratricopeptide (TPR) repeat protein